MATISVIIPTLNEEKLLPGMLAQFTPEIVRDNDLEIVVSDGGSTDGTLDIARSRAHMVVENVPPVKQTISMGRNRGAAHASGEIFVFLNADTLVKDISTFFPRIREEMSSPDIVALTASVFVYPHEETRADRWFHGFYNWFFTMMNRVGMGMGRGECHIMRRETFARVQGYAERIAAGEDYDMFRRLINVGRVTCVKDLVVFESPRRYRRYGYARVTASWFLNFLSVFFLRRSLLSEWKPIR